MVFFLNKETLSSTLNFNVSGLESVPMKKIVFVCVENVSVNEPDNTLLHSVMNLV